LEIAVSVLIIACPCALSLAAPFAYGTAAAKLAQHNFYVKSGRVLASLASVQTLFWDKTGTLTRRGKKSSDISLAKEDAAVLRGILDRSTHPVAQAMLDAIGDGERLALEDWEEMVGSGIVARDGQGNVWRIGSGRWLHLTEGLTYVMRGDDILWQWEPQWTYRSLGPMFEQLKAKGKNLHLLSGDRPRKLPEGWERYFGSNQWFEQRPEDKMRRVAQVEHSMYLGDGLNDVEAMAAADVGVAVVEDVLGFFPKGNAVIFASALVGVPNFLRYARRMKNWVRGAYALSLTYNLIGLGFALSGALSPVVAAILMPLSSITVVLFSVLGAYLWAPRH
jgi:Cu+-exporting ATPase